MIQLRAESRARPSLGTNIQRFLAQAILTFLGLGLREIHSRDLYLQSEWDFYPQGTRVEILPDPVSKPLHLVKDQGIFRIQRAEELEPPPTDNQGVSTSQGRSIPHFIITFKSLADAWPILLGRISVQDGYLQNRMVVAGDLMVILPMVRGLMRVVQSLFPKFLILSTLGDEPITRPTLSTAKIYGLMMLRMLPK